MAIVNSIRPMFALLLPFLLLWQPSAAQQQEAPPPSVFMTSSPTEEQRLAYVLGASDQLVIRVAGAVEFNDKTFLIDPQGNVVLPLVDAVKAGGLTIQQFEAELIKKLSSFYRSPQVRVSVLQYRVDSVFCVGGFQRPGVYSLQGQRKLTEMLAIAGGLLPNAVRQLTLTRRLEQGRLPLANAVEDRNQGTSAAEISLTRLMETANPAEDIILKPNDVIRVPLREEEMIYVQGAKSGAFPLGDKSSLSVMQVISLAGGLPPDVKLKKVVVLRSVMDTTRRAELPVDLKGIMAGKANDFPLLANDVLVIPQAQTSRAGKMVWAIVPLTIGVASLLLYTTR